MKPVKIPFTGNNNHERLNSEDSQLVSERANEVIYVNFETLRKSVYAENPYVVLKKDNLLPKPATPSVASVPHVAESAINHIVNEERREASEADELAAKARSAIVDVYDSDKREGQYDIPA
jgi:hypothetical protein